MWMFFFLFGVPFIMIFFTEKIFLKFALFNVVFFFNKTQGRELFNDRLASQIRTHIALIYWHKQYTSVFAVFIKVYMDTLKGIEQQDIYLYTSMFIQITWFYVYYGYTCITSIW